MKFSLAAQFLSSAFAAAVASPSSASVAEELAKKKYDKIHRDIDGAAAAAAAATSRAVPSRSRDLVSTSTSTSKSSKSSSYCPPEPTKDVECGNVYTNTTVILGNNLICEGNITEADDSRNFAIKLSGKEAVLNCQGHTVSQVTESSAAALDCPIFPSNSTERLRMKQGCGLLYQFGIYLEDGASMKDCNVQKFYVGGRIDNGGAIEGSEFSLNRNGLDIVNFPGIGNTLGKVTHSAFYNNFYGLSANQYNNEENANAVIIVEDAIAKNDAYGLFLTGSGITVNNADIKNCDILGLFVPPIPGIVNKVTLAGDISVTNSGGIATGDSQQPTSYVNVTGNLNSNHNKFGFFPSDSFTQGSFHVTGNLNLNQNEYGLVSYAGNIIVGDSYSGSGKSGKSGSSGSLTACDNSIMDITNFGSTFEGTGYTCGTTNGTNLPECMPCYPVCPSASTRSRSLRHVLGLSLSDLDLVEDLAVEMDIQYPTALI